MAIESKTTTSGALTMTRRDAVTGAAVLGAGVAAALGTGAASNALAAEAQAGAADGEVSANPAWLGDAPAIADADIADTWDTDLLIVGAGNSGMLAAARAADAGLDFRIVEAAAGVCMSRDFYAAVNTEECAAAGCEVDVDKLRGEIARYASGKCDSRVVNLWVNESNAMHEYVKGIMAQYGFVPTCSADTGVETSGTDYYNPPIQHSYSSTEEGEYSSYARNDVLKDYIEKKGYAVDFNTELVELVMAEDGAGVAGAIVYNSDDKAYIRVNAKNVILASGGYAANPEMMMALQPLTCKCINTARYHFFNTGQGLKAALWAGAVKDVEPAVVIFDRGAVAPGTDSGYVQDESGEWELPGTLGTQQNEYNPGTQPFLKVNRDGERFANESCPYNDILFAAANQKGGTYCQVYDANFQEDWQRFHTLGCSSVTRMIPEVMAAAIEGNVEAGIIMKADTLDELADKLGFEGAAKETFLATCDRYNELFDQQHDDDFGKAAYRLSELRTAPFYGVWMGGLLLTTLDGVKINPKAQALDASGEVVPGLYAVGDVSGNFFANNYPSLLPGLCCGRGLTEAIKAVDTIVAEG